MNKPLNKHQRAVVEMLKNVVPHDGQSLSEALHAFGHGIAVLSTSSGDRNLQKQFLEHIFTAIRMDAEETMTYYDEYRGIEQPVSADAVAKADEVIRMFKRAVGGTSRG
jgi:hypothetical protein